MQKDEHELCTVGIGGIAGDGIIETGHTLGSMLTALGYQVSASFTYPSLIRGGGCGFTSIIIVCIFAKRLAFSLNAIRIFV